MLLRNSRLIAAACALLLSLASVAGAEVLWDQSNWDQPGTPGEDDGSVNLSSNSCNQISGNTKAHTACDVHFDSPVRITTVRIYEKRGNVEAATTARLWIYPKTGPLPTTPGDSLELPSLIVPITAVLEGTAPSLAVRVTAGGLDVELPAGDYWVSLTPIHNLGLFPYTIHFHTAGPVIGDPTVAINACPPPLGPGPWVYPLDPIKRPDYAIKIEGEVRRPTAEAPTGVRGEVPGP